jgi:hypothetical protein
MMMDARRLMVAVGCALVLAACSGDDAVDAVPGPTPPPRSAEATLVTLDSLPDEVEAAISDAAVRFGVPRPRSRSPVR